MAWQDSDDPALNRKLLQSLKEAIDNIEEIYSEHKAVKFSVFHRNLKDIYDQFSQSLDQTSDLEAAQDVADSASGQLTKSIELMPDEKLVYVRIYHRHMEKYFDPIWQQNWFRPLMDSVKNSERHGLAVYGLEEHAQAATKNAQYAYVTLRIKENQDITRTRPARSDPDIHCPLLVIDKVIDTDIITFNYLGRSFAIRNGTLQARGVA